MHSHVYIATFFLDFSLLNFVYTFLLLHRGIHEVKGGTIRLKTVEYVHGISD